MYVRLCFNVLVCAHHLATGKRKYFAHEFLLGNTVFRRYCIEQARGLLANKSYDFVYLAHLGISLLLMVLSASSTCL